MNKNQTMQNQHESLDFKGKIKTNKDETKNSELDTQKENCRNNTTIPTFIIQNL